MGVDQQWWVALDHGQFGRITKQTVTKSKGKKIKSAFEMRQIEASPENRGGSSTVKTEEGTEDCPATTVPFPDHTRKRQTAVKETEFDFL